MHLAFENNSFDSSASGHGCDGVVFAFLIAAQRIEAVGEGVQVGLEDKVIVTISGNDDGRCL